MPRIRHHGVHNWITGSPNDGFVDVPIVDGFTKTAEAKRGTTAFFRNVQQDKLRRYRAQAHTSCVATMVHRKWCLDFLSDFAWEATNATPLVCSRYRSSLGTPSGVQKHLDLSFCVARELL